MMKYHILALFIAVVAILQPVSCDEQRITRTLQAIKIKKEKKSSKSLKSEGNNEMTISKEKKSSKSLKSEGNNEMTISKEMKSSKEKNEITSSFVADNVSRACTTDDYCKGLYGNSKSAGCWLGKCQMCMPSSHYRKFRGGKCRCAKNGGGNDNFDVYIRRDGLVDNVSIWPPFGGQFRDRCNECRRRLEADGVIMSGSSCSRSLQNSMYLSPLNMDNLWKDFGPPNVSHTIGRYPADCIPNSGGGQGCKLRCGIHNGSQMHINYNPTIYFGESGRVEGLPVVLGDWRNGCLACGSNLETYGFIKSGWECSFPFDGIFLVMFEYRMQ